MRMLKKKKKKKEVKINLQQWRKGEKEGGRKRPGNLVDREIGKE